MIRYRNALQSAATARADEGSRNIQANQEAEAKASEERGILYPVAMEFGKQPIKKLGGALLNKVGVKDGEAAVSDVMENGIPAAVRQVQRQVQRIFTGTGSAAAEPATAPTQTNVQSEASSVADVESQGDRPSVLQGGGQQRDTELGADQDFEGTQPFQQPETISQTGGTSGGLENVGTEEGTELASDSWLDAIPGGELLQGAIAVGTLLAGIFAPQHPKPEVNAVPNPSTQFGV